MTTAAAPPTIITHLLHVFIAGELGGWSYWRSSYRNYGTNQKTGSNQSYKHLSEAALHMLLLFRSLHHDVNDMNAS